MDTSGLESYLDGGSAYDAAGNSWTIWQLGYTSSDDSGCLTDETKPDGTGGGTRVFTDKVETVRSDPSAHVCGIRVAADAVQEPDITKIVWHELGVTWDVAVGGAETQSGSPTTQRYDEGQLLKAIDAWTLTGSTPASS